jgi:class 3 adenylate cyclase
VPAARDHVLVRGLPSGTVTFLFTDIEGSTRLLRELGERYADVLAEHNRILREAFARHDGLEVGSWGDSLFVAFVDAGSAVAAAGDVQAALAGGPVQVRIGVHTGEAVVSDEGYVGLDVNRAARIMSAGHGGHVRPCRSLTTLREPLATPHHYTSRHFEAVQGELTSCR